MSDMVDMAEYQLTAAQMLSQAREAMGLSQDQVAQELYLTPNYIRLIDSDEIDKIQKQAFVRGYLRSYAKMVRLNGDEVVARYEVGRGSIPQNQVQIRGVTQESLSSTNFTGPVFQTGILGLVGLVIIIALVWFLSGSDEEEPIVVGSTASSSTGNTRSVTPAAVDPYNRGSGNSADESAEGDQLNFNDQQTSAEIQDSVSTLPLTTTDVQSIRDNTPAELVAIAARNEPKVADPISGKRISIERLEGVVKVTAGGEDELRFLFSDECWVEIEDGQGDSIYGDLNRAGDELVVSGIAPFEVLFGKAPAVTLEYNGEPIDLAPHTTSVDTAKLKVGS
jgi:cytoskeleton protein RodZ